MFKNFSARDRRRIVARLNRKWNRKIEDRGFREVIFNEHPDWFAKV